MYESSPRSREVANALFQIDRLTEDQVRAILRHIAIDDAILNEAQCSHVASVINGTLNKAPREGVNAFLTCGTSLDAASHWEKSFANHPGVSLHNVARFDLRLVLTRIMVQPVSAIFRKSSIGNDAEANQSANQLVLFKPEESAHIAANNSSNGSKPSVSGPPELQGLSIINQGQLTLHYHSYGTAQSSSYQPVTESRKRGLEKEDDEQYSEALASLMDFDLSAPKGSKIRVASKRRRLEKPGSGMVQAEDATADAEAELIEAEAQEQQGGAEKQTKVKQEEDQHMKKKKNKTKLCKKCGKMFNPDRNNGPINRCCFHPGM